MKTTRLPLLLIALAATAHVSANDFKEKTVRYTLGDTRFEGTVTWEAEADEALPGILMVPNWMGPTEASLKKARKVAEMGFVVMMVDMYGAEVRPQNASEASQAAGAVRADRALMRQRAQEALNQFRMVKDIPLDAGQIAAIGFCFGGGTVLELARSGADVDAVISFHGDLLSPTLESDSSAITAKVLVLHGAMDPYVPQDHVQQFVSAMRETGVDWQLVQFSEAVHSFTDPQANSPGQAFYHERTADRAFEYMEELLEEIWETDD